MDDSGGDWTIQVYGRCSCLESLLKSNSDVVVLLFDLADAADEGCFINGALSSYPMSVVDSRDLMAHVVLARTCF